MYEKGRILAYFSILARVRVLFVTLEEQMLLSIGSHFSGMDFVNPPIVRIAPLKCLSTFFVWTLSSKTGEQYSTAEYINDIVLDMRNIFASALLCRKLVVYY